MAIPVDVTFQHMWPTDEVMNLVQNHAEDLKTAFDDMKNCKVTIERPRARKGKKRKFRVNVTISTQEQIWEESCHTSAISEHGRLNVALSNAFRKITPRLYACTEGNTSNGLKPSPKDTRTLQRQPNSPESRWAAA